MKKIIAPTLATIVAGLVVGCAAPRYSDVPAPTRFENSKQQQLQAAHHWQLIAGHFAKQIASDVQGKLGERAVFMPQPGGEQAFVQGFRELLTTELVQQGVPVSTSAGNALTVEVSYSIYRFRPERAASTYYYGDAVALTAGLWAIGGIAVANVSSAAGVSAGAKLLTAAAGLEGFAWVNNEQRGRGEYTNGAVPRSEMILTASVTDNSRIVSRRSAIYYTADDEPGLYWNRSGAGHTLSVTAGSLSCEGGKSCGR
ncbi:MAG: hypothetical protein WAZ34_12620 [Rhodocyclaceae bacterium]